MTKIDARQQRRREEDAYLEEMARRFAEAEAEEAGERAAWEAEQERLPRVGHWLMFFAGAFAVAFGVALWRGMLVEALFEALAFLACLGGSGADDWEPRYYHYRIEDVPEPGTGRIWYAAWAGERTAGADDWEDLT